MRSATGLLASLCLALASVGCTAHRHVVNTVPCWKGLPCMLIAPSSLEAHVWRQRLHAGHADRSSCEAIVCGCDQCAAVDETQMLAPQLDAY
jgi:hypothetical protein